MNNKYIGSRYVPKIVGEWTNTQSYEPLLIVTYQGNSYTSKSYVPVGIDINNTNFWVCTGNFNTQIEYYRQDVNNYKTEVDGFNNRITNAETSLLNKVDLKNIFTIEHYGGKANDITFDNYNAYMLAINDPNCTTISFGKGKYYFSKMVLYNAKNIIGQGTLNTEIIAMDSSETSFISLNKGPVAYNLYKGFMITGNKNNTNQTGLYLYGLPQDTSPYHGGFWYNLLEDIYVSKFTNNQIHMEGYDPRSSALVPIQFNTFINVRAFGDSSSNNVIEIISQNGQTMFLNCQFDQANTTSYNVYTKGADCIFQLLTCQDAKYGIYQEGGSISLFHSWIEGVNNPITTSNSSTTFGGCLTMEGGTVRNCATASGEYICKTSSRTIIDMKNIMFMGSKIDTVFSNVDSEISSITTQNLYFSAGYTTSYTKNYVLVSPDGNSNLKFNSNKMNYVSSGTVSTIELGGWVASMKEVYCFTLSGTGVVFSGSVFINPQTVVANKYFKLNFIDGKWLITILN